MLNKILNKTLNNSDLGFSLFEMIISISLTCILITSAIHFYPQLKLNIDQNSKQFHLELIIEQTLLSLAKEIKRAGFIKASTDIKTFKPIEILNNSTCIILRFENPLQKDLINNFGYRFANQNIEFKVDAENCFGTNWFKLFDPNEIKVTHFTIKLLTADIEINLAATRVNNPNINYQTTKIIHNENIY